MTSHQYSVSKSVKEYDLSVAMKSVIVPTVITFLYSLFAFVAQPLFTVFTEVMFTPDTKKFVRADNYASFLTGTVNGQVIGVMLLALGGLYAFFAFRFLSKKKMVNVYLSGSADRKTLFSNRVKASLGLMDLAIFLPIVIDLVINLACLGHPQYLIPYAIALYAESITYAFAGFAIGSIAMIYCTTAIEGLFFGGAIAMAPSALLGTLNSLCVRFLNGFNRRAASFSSVEDYVSESYFSGQSIEEALSFINPLILGKALNGGTVSDNIFNFCYRMLVKPEYPGDVMYGVGTDYAGYENIPFSYIAPIIIWLCISTAMIFIARRLMIGYKAENAGVHGTRPVASRIFAVVTSLSVAMLATSSLYIFDILNIFTTNTSAIQNGGRILFAVVAMVAFALSYLIINAIERRTVVLKAKELITPAVSLSVLGLTIAVLTTGCFGYSTYVPKAEQVEVAVISNPYFYSTGEDLASTYPNNYYDGVFYGTYAYDGFAAAFTDSKDIEAVTELNNRLVQKTDKQSQQDITVYYRLKNGKEVVRKYEYVDKDAALETINLYDTKAVRENLAYIFGKSKDKNPFSRFADDEKIYESLKPMELDDAKTVLELVNPYAVDENNICTYKTIKNTPQLINALYKDLSNQSGDERFRPQEKALGGIYFTSEIYDDNGNYVESTTSFYFEGGFYVYPSMTNTVNYLKSTGELALFTSSKEIKSVTVSTVDNVLKREAAQALFYGEDDLYIFHSVSSIPVYYSVEDDMDEYDDEYEYDKPITYYFEDGKVLTNKKQVKQVLDSSALRYAVDTQEKGYVALVAYNDGSYTTKFIPQAKAPDFLEK